MEERTVQAPPERPLTAQDDAATAPATGHARPTHGEPAHLADPRALTILTTEHWSLLSARSLVYNEAFARGGMFLTFLSATLVALGLVSTATGFSREFLLIAAVVLALDLFIGLATMGRVAAATSEDIRYLQGMNRIRHAYHELVPELEAYFISGRHDDMAGVFAVYGTTTSVRSRAGILHGLTTTVGMVGVICAAVGAVLVGVLALLATGHAMGAGLAAIVAFAAGVAWSTWTMIREIARFGATMQSNFPSPPPAAPPDGRRV
jgi:cytochrome c biogenesis protein CcdA